MCIFSYDVDQVSGTVVFITGDRRRQLTVYGNTVALHKEQPVVMFLPVPGKMEDVQFPAKQEKFWTKELFTSAEQDFRSGMLRMPRSKGGGVRRESVGAFDVALADSEKAIASSGIMKEFAVSKAVVNFLTSTYDAKQFCYLFSILLLRHR